MKNEKKKEFLPATVEIIALDDTDVIMTSPKNALNELEYDYVIE